MPKDPIDIWPAIDVRPIAEDLIAQYHPHLLDAKIIYAFTNQQRKKCDRVRLASASRLGNLHKFLSSGMRSVLLGHDFVMLIDAHEWQELTEAQRVALVDHECCHMGRDEVEKSDGTIEGKWILRGHDIEEFSEILQRHGVWREEIKVMASVIRQLPLLEEPTVTISAGQESVTLTDQEFRQAVKRVAGSASQP